MKVKCLYNTGETLLDYPRVPFGVSKETQYGQLKINNEYLVMGMILGEGTLDYLIDGEGIVSACPYQLFEVVDSGLNPNWFFRAFKKNDKNFPYWEAVWGYYELVFEDSHYEKLIDMDEGAHKIYFKRKIELENALKEEI